MFDVNPEPGAGNPRHTALSGTHIHVGLGPALVEFGRHCGIRHAGVRTHIDELSQVIDTMPEVADGHGLGEQDIHRQVTALETIRSHALTTASRQPRTAPVIGAARRKATPGGTPGS